MMEWDSRMKNTHMVKILKAAIPFLDVDEGEHIDLEGLLGAIHPFTAGRERRMVELFLQFFQLRHMMDMMQLVQSMQQAETTSGEDGAAETGAEEEKDGDAAGAGMFSGFFEGIKAMMPAEQQGNLDMLSSMMTMMQMPEDASPDFADASSDASEVSELPSTPEDALPSKQAQEEKDEPVNF